MKTGATHPGGLRARWIVIPVVGAVAVSSAIYFSQARTIRAGPTAKNAFAGVYVATRPLLNRRNNPAPDYRAAPSGGVYIRLAWQQIEPTPDRYDWSLLDQHLDAAVAARKKISLSLIAGGFSPTWLPTKATTSNFRVGKGGARRRCTNIVIGRPWDPAYQTRYTRVMTALADHVRARPDAYAALRIVKMTAIAQNTEEMRLPSTDGDRSWRGRPDPCDASDALATWKADGYTIAKVVAGWRVIARGVGQAFPDKVIAQDVLDRNDFPVIPGAPDGPDPKRQIIASGASILKGRFAVQWNGLTAGGRVAQSVVEAGRQGAIIGWQTNAFRGQSGAGCNADRSAMARPCSEPDYAAILARGVALGGRYIEVWDADTKAFPAAIRRTDAALASAK